MIIFAETKLDNFVRMNIVSQAINWFITFLYFATPIADKIKNCLEIEKIISNINEQSFKDWTQYGNCVSEYGLNENDESLAQFEDKINLELKAYCKEIDWNKFSMIDKYKALLRLKKRAVLAGTPIAIAAE